MVKLCPSILGLLLLLPYAVSAHTGDNHAPPMDKEALRQHIADEFMAQRMALAKAGHKQVKALKLRHTQVAASAFNFAMLATGATVPVPGNGELMAASFAPFKPKVRYYWDANYFYEESDGLPDRTRQPNLMVGITSWQQQVPLPLSYFSSTTNGATNTGSLGYQQPNYWKIPLVPVPAASPISLTGNFLRGAVALGSDGVPIFNPRNNTGQFSYAIGELDAYGGHCGLGDDYHYHIFPVHLTPVLGNDKPIAWGLDGYPVYGYVEPDGSAMQALDGDGGHDHGGWGYHYHARGTFNAGTGTWTPTSPYMMNAMHGAVVNFDSQIDPQPTGSGLRASGTGGYTAQPVAGAVVTAFKNPVALSTDGSGHLIENVAGVPSDDQWLMRYTVSGTTYDLCWRLNRSANPKTMTITWRHPTSGTTTTTYNSVGNRITAYPMAGASQVKLPDTSQTLDTTATPGEDADYTLNAQSFADNGNGTVTDNITGLMWQKVDNGESTWESAVTNAAGVTTGGHSDWRLPTPSELFSIFNHDNGNPALNTTYFPNNSPAAGYWWTSDLYGSSTTNVWCANSGGGLGPKPKTETLSAGGVLRYHARYVRGAKPTNGHNYVNNDDGTVTDLDTALMWTQVPGSSRAWDAALSYAEGLTTGGFSDWRLPNVKELQTLTDYARASATGSATLPAIQRTLFPAATANAYWSSTTLKSGATTTEAWVVEFGINSASTPPRNSQGIISYGVKTETYPVFAVRTASLVQTDIAVTENGASLTDGVSTVNYGNVNVGSTASKTFTITNNGTASLSITGVAIDGNAAALFTVTGSPASSVAAGASTTVSVQFNASSAGAKTAALHIASSDSSVGSAFDINLTGTGVTPPPVISSVVTSPSVPGSSDTPYITASVTPGSGASIAGVQLTYSTGSQTTGPAFREIFSNGSTASGIAGAMNTWAATAVRAAADVKQRGATGNHTAPVVLTNCLTTAGSTTVTCGSTTGLIPGMLITGTNIAGTNVSTPATVATTITSIPNGTTFVMSQAATASGTGLSLTAAGVSLTGCSLGTSPVINCANTTGLAVGMGIVATTGTLTTAPPNPTVATLTNATSFSVGAGTTVTAVPATITASGTGLEFANGTVNYTDTMATTGVISSAAPTAGNVEFWVRNADLISNNGWTFQISPDGGSTWNTRMSENFASKSAVNCTLNATTTVACSDTSGLTVGNSIQGNAIAVAACSTNATTTVTTANTSGLVVGMFISGPTAAGIPANARITAITAGVGFTLSAAATATAGPVTLTASWLAANATISAITSNVSFTLNTAAFASGSGITLSAVNHGFQLKHYDLVAADMSANMMLRFQYSGYAGAVAPARVPAVDVDDITVTLTTGAAPATVAMLDDGLHGDGAAGDGVYGVQLPAQVAGTTVSYSISATDSSGTTTLSSAGSYTTGPSPTITSSTTLPNAAPNVAYATTLVASSGTGGYVWSTVTGALPSGLTLSGAGAISGTTSAPGVFNVTLKVTDSAGRVAVKAFTLNVTTVTAPNIVFIVTDDQGWGDVSYHTASGQVPVQTPNMARLGTEGIRLEKFYATPVCATTRCSLLTGRSTLRTNSGNQRGVSITEHMMPETFRAAGYQTFMCGKWHLGGWGNDIYTTTLNGTSFTVQHEGPEFHPQSRGWDSHYGQYGGAIGYFTHTSSDPGLGNRLDWWLNGVATVETTDLQGHGGYSTDLLADKAVTQIVNRDKSKPMLLYLAFNGVHAGVQAPASFITKYQNLGVTDVSRRTLCAAVDCMDVAMGRVLNALDSEGITNNTIVVYLSDNGGEESAGSLNDPLRGTKTDSYEGGIHTPAAIRWPGVLATGVTSNQHVWVGDLFPTLCAAVGVTPLNPKPFDGINLWPALQGISSASPDGQVRSTALVIGATAHVAMKTFTDPVNGGTKMFKIIRNRSAGIVNELFNLTDDPYETTDLLLGANAASYSSIVTTLTTSITSITVENYAPYVGPPGIAQSVQQGTSTTLYAAFTSYGKVPSVQWRKGGSAISGATSYYQITDDGAAVTGVYMATLTLDNVNGTHAASYDVVVSSANGTSTSQAGLVTVVKPVSTQNDGVPDAWKLAHGIDPGSASTANGPVGDLDGDGVSNLLEYALNTDPRAAATSPVQGISATKVADGLKYLQVSYPRRIGAVDVAYTVEVSDDLALWTSPGTSFETVGTVPAGDGITETVTVRVLPAMSSTAKKFVRLKVTAQ